ncbi:hypothetical protein KAFR_0E02130 [Kazachstania africana CBS 2517]|uniref:Uncharacterized protein n=1 Tax=Kazachstania africana (strain ATCC 22294 / BCRC 22015 / CBS 2517 / CECT 1963 / NBRC 1671 / NRRL Y-8276) TaxID=1071382 RepID=H2AVG6_KAZAF|nr:hypothetical protein KAFR_0E02130 [Kazachstania africana CBS 2517]CCF58366.1 hypothetical protein KAFR_0E02130 [Kazachstania africana CBS 2517]
MEVRGKIVIKDKSSRVDDVVSYEIDTSRVLLTINSDKQTFNSADRVNQYLTKELVQILKQVYREYASTALTINLNFSKLQYPLHYWEQLLYYILLSFSLPNKIYITEQTKQDRQRYVNQNKNYYSFVERITVGAVDEGETNEEYAVKTILMHLFELRNANDSQIEEILNDYTSINNIIQNFF